MHRPLLLAMAVLALGGVPRAGAAVPAAARCEATAASALVACVQRVAVAARRCYLATKAPCPPGDPRVAAALAKLAHRVESRCTVASVQAAGFGALATPASLVARLAESCAGEPATLAARTFGGPQGAVLAGATSADASCLGAAYKEASALLKATARAQGGCIQRTHAGGSCNVASTAARVGAAASKAQTKIAAACPANRLAALIGLDPGTFASRAGAQARCMVATAHGSTDPLTLDCGPRPAVPVPAPGQWTQIVLDSATGALCGDGSPYAFWVRLAPGGSPPGRIVTWLQGGGVCVFESDCDAVPPGLFQSLADAPPTAGVLSSDPSVNPFADWTQVFLPYCTQDVHIGGGTQSVFPSITVNRYGAINVRAALRYVRDALWSTLEATTPEGYRPDLLTVFFTGGSAGGFGVVYNYHYLLDELRWIHTTAVPDAAAGLDNGMLLSVKNLGALVGGTTNPFGWNTVQFQPPYCIAGDCGVILPRLEQATSVRLKAVPEQQILNVTNQVDTVQESTTFFSTLPDWINALRTAYCAVQGEKGLRFWMPAESTSFHTILTVGPRFDTVTAGGVTVADWLAGAVASPDGVVDEVDEGTLVTDYPGVNPIACLASPSGAFLDPMR
jgi:hypothetical protein